LKTIKFDIRVIKTTASKIVICGNLVGKPSDNDSLSTSVCANRIATGNVIDSRAKKRAKIKAIHKKSIYGLKGRTTRGVPYRFAVATTFGCPLGFK